MGKEVGAIYESLAPDVSQEQLLAEEWPATRKLCVSSATVNVDPLLQIGDALLLG